MDPISFAGNVTLNFDNQTYSILNASKLFQNYETSELVQKAAGIGLEILSDYSNGLCALGAGYFLAAGLHCPKEQRVYKFVSLGLAALQASYVYYKQPENLLTYFTPFAVAFLIKNLKISKDENRNLAEKNTDLENMNKKLKNDVGLVDYVIEELLHAENNKQKDEKVEKNLNR